MDTRTDYSRWDKSSTNTTTKWGGGGESGYSCDAAERGERLSSHAEQLPVYLHTFSVCKWTWIRVRQKMLPTFNKTTRHEREWGYINAYMASSSSSSALPQISWTVLVLITLDVAITTSNVGLLRVRLIYPETSELYPQLHEIILALDSLQWQRAFWMRCPISQLFNVNCQLTTCQTLTNKMSATKISPLQKKRWNLLSA